MRMILLALAAVGASAQISNAATIDRVTAHTILLGDPCSPDIRSVPYPPPYLPGPRPRIAGGVVHETVFRPMPCFPRPRLMF